MQSLSPDRWPLTSMWLAANERAEIRVKVTVSVLAGLIASNSPRQRNLHAYQRMARQYVGS